jgi:hypothetical protein
MSTRQAAAAAISVNGALEFMTLLGFLLGRLVVVVFYGSGGDSAVKRPVTALSPRTGHAGSMGGRA